MNLPLEGYLLERLSASGWNRGVGIYWRLSDAEAAAWKMLESPVCRGFRIVRFVVEGEAISTGLKKRKDAVAETAKRLAIEMDLEIASETLPGGGS